MYSWIKKFLTDRWITVRIGTELSTKYLVENGTPQGSIVSQVLFSIMINEVFSKVDRSISVALFADDGVMWKKGRNIDYIVRKMQEAIGKVENWGMEWGNVLNISGYGLIENLSGKYILRKLLGNVKEY